MKKLRKSNLDELADKMPVLSTEENLECVGGDYYFDNAGTYLGQTGPNQNVYVSTLNNFSNYSGNPTYLASISETPTDYSGQLTTLAKIGNYMRPYAGISSGINIIVNSGVYINGVHDYTSIAAFNGSTLFLNGNQNTLDSIQSMKSAYEWARINKYVSGTLSIYPR